MTSPFEFDDFDGVAKVKASFTDYARLKGITLREALREQTRSLSRRLVRDTPPKSRSVGQRRVKAQIEGLIRIPTPKNTAWIRDKELRSALLKAGRNRDTATLARLVKVAGMKDEVVEGDGIAAFHQKHRNRLGGVRNRGFRAITADRETLRAYVAHKRTQVGLAKGGWAAALLGSGGTASEWIVRHADKAGSFQDRTHDLAPFFEIDNASPWAGRGDVGHRYRVTQAALVAQEGAFDKAFAHAADQAAGRAFRTP